MIPKIIHQFRWEDSKTKENVLSVKRTNGGWKHKVWTLEDVKKSYGRAPEHFKSKFDYFFENNMTLHAQDISKFWILFSEGGIYMDNGYRFKAGKSLTDLKIVNSDLALFNCSIKPNSWRFDESVMAGAPNEKFFMHLMDYIGHPRFLPKSEWDGSILEVYASSYITTHYDLYTRLYNNEELIENSVSVISNTDKKVIPKNHKILNPHVAFLKNPELVFRHFRNTKFFEKLA